MKKQFEAEENLKLFEIRRQANFIEQMRENLTGR